MLCDLPFGTVKYSHHIIVIVFFWFLKKGFKERQTGHSLLVTLWGEHNPIRVFKKILVSRVPCNS